MKLRREKWRPSGAKKRLCLALACAQIALAGCGQDQDAEQWKPEDVTLLEPVGVTAAYETAARRNLYDVETYYGLVCPYIEEYELDGDLTFDSYDALPGDPVKKGDTLLHADYEDIDRQIESWEERIAEMDEEYRKFLEQDETSREKPLEDQSVFGKALENFANPPEEYLPDGVTVNPAYEAWKKNYDDPAWGYASCERKYRQAVQKLLELDEAKKERTELYGLDREYSLLRLERLKEDKRTQSLRSGMDGYVAGLSRGWGAYETEADMLLRGMQAPSRVPLVAVCDPGRLEIRSQYLARSAYQNAEDVYAVVDGKRYEVAYTPYETPEEYERKKEENGGTVYGVFYPVGDTQGLTMGAYALVVVKNQTRENVVTVPTDALVQEGKEYYAYVLDDSGYVYTRVEVGISDSMYTEIVSGLQEGDRVRTDKAVTAGAETVKVTKGKLCSQVETTGTIRYPDTEWVVNPIKYGTCYFMESFVHERQAVKKGDVLAEIRVVPDQAGLERNEMRLKREKERLQDLVSQGGEEENEDAVLAKREEISELEELLADMRADAATTKILAPRDGIIRTVAGSYTENTLLFQDQQLFQISDQRVMYLDVTNSGDQLTYGNTVTVQYKDKDQASKTAQGQVVTAGAMSLSGNMYTQRVLVKLPQEDFVAMAEVAEGRNDYYYVPDTKFKVTAQVRVMDNVLLVPKKAVTVVGKNCYVKVRLETGEIQYRSFLSGGSDDSNYWALEGLTEGMELCLD